MTSTFADVAPDLTKGGAWMVAMRLLIRLLGLVNVVILARLLSPTDFGIVAMATLVVGLLQLFSDVSVDLLLLRREKIDDQLMNVAWTLQIIAGVAITLASLLLAPLLVLYYAEPRVSVAIFIVALQPAIAGFENVGVVQFRRRLQFQREFWYWVIRHVVRFLFGLGLALALRSYLALAVAVPMSSAITVAVSFCMSPFRPRLALSGLKELWLSARWLVTLNVGQYLTYRSDEFVVGGFAGSSNMGAYYVASDVATIANRELVGALGRAIYPTLSLINGKAGETRSAFVRVFAFHVAACLAIGVGLALVAPDVVSLLLGDKWAVGIPVFQWIALCSVFEGLILATLPFFITTGRERFVGLFHAGHAAFLIVALVAARQTGNFVFLAQVRCIVAGLALLVCLSRVNRLGHVGWRDLAEAAWRPLIAAGLMSLLLNWPLGHAALPIKIAAGVMTFLGSLYALWAIAGRPQSTERDAMEIVAGLRRALP